MAKQIINIGSQANDRSGDPLRTAFDKINQNFTELYTTASLDIQIPVQSGNVGKYLTTNGSVLSWSTVASGTTDKVVNGLLNITLNATGDFIPSTDILQDLGSATNRFRHLYVGPGSVYIGNNVITESATGGLVLPGVTRATGYYAEEVDDEDDWGSNPTITGTVTVIDATRYQILAGQNPSANYNPATYTVEKDGNKIDEINVSNGGSGWTKSEADYARNNNMYATNVVDAINNFNAGDWQQIPFRVEIKAEDTEYEDIFGGGADLGSFTIDSNVLSVNSGTDIYIETYETDGDGESRLILKPQDNGAENPTRLEGSYGVGIWSNTTDGDNIRKWLFGTDGDLKLPAGGDIVDSSGNSVLGGNANTGNVVFDNNQLYVGGTGFLNLENSDDQIEIGSNNEGPVKVSVNEGDKAWYFNVNGTLQLPAGGDVVDSNGDSVLGGGSNSYTPEDTDHWNEPTVNSVAAALDELAARVTALQNYEIDGGNAYTPPQGETIIDGNGA